MTAVSDVPNSDAGLARHEGLAAAISKVRVRPGFNLPVERILLAAAVVLFPLGLVFILLGWEGAAHNGHTYAQIDYLISGGLFGLGLSVAGGFMYFGYWLSRQLNDSRRQNGLTLQALGRIEELLDAQLNSRVATGPFAPLPAPVASGRNGTAPAPADAPTGEVAMPLLMATPRGSLLHRPECAVVARRDDLRQVPAGTDGFGYCTMCDAAGVLA
ncbi:MAG TPA: hypothetical protein VFH70_01305 [Acidimicrobiales bacterium]|nr:hypothetical protein [Acidimicrobiales bacterium]